MPSQREKLIIRLFLRGHNRTFRTTYKLSEWPEEVEGARRSSKPGRAIDALAVDAADKKLAIEHTIIEAFEGATGSDARFESIARALKGPSQRLLGYHLIVYMRLRSICGMNAAEREELGRTLAGWFERVKVALPEGMSRRRPRLCGRRLTVAVYKRRHEGYPGLVSFQRYPQPAFAPRLPKALDDKIPKLREYRAESRILLLEKRDFDTPNSWRVGEQLQRLERSSGLSQVNEVWVADVAYALYGDTSPLEFHCVWPTVNEKFFHVPATEAQIKTLKALR